MLATTKAEMIGQDAQAIARELARSAWAALAVGIVLWAGCRYGLDGLPPPEAMGHGHRALYPLFVKHSWAGGILALMSAWLLVARSRRAWWWLLVWLRIQFFAGFSIADEALRAFRSGQGLSVGLLIVGAFVLPVVLHELLRTTRPPSWYEPPARKVAA